MKCLVLGGLAIVAALMLKVAQPVFAQPNCDNSYPDFCIAPPPPDLDCGDITQKNFTVRQPDPHRFDRDKDGVGCEA
jgi:hypothetical protein